MSKELKIIPKVNAKTNQKFDETVGCLILEKSENFSFTIEESDTFAPDKPKSLKPFSLGVSDVDYDRMTKYNQQVQNKEIKSYNKKAEAHKAEMASFDKKMKPKRDTVSWAWQVVGNGIKPHNITHNQGFSKGIDANTLYNFTFPKVLEGGGMAWLEVFTDTDPATGKIPYGMFVQAKGEPKIIRIEWTDQDYNPIPESTVVAFNSQLILHIYTSGMYGQEVEVNLFDKDVFSGDDPLNISKEKAFTREVVLKEVKPHEKGKYGVSGFLVSSNQSKAKGTVEGATVVQKIEIKVSIQSDWKTDAGGNLWIYPTVKALETGKVFEGLDRQKLHVHKNGISFDVPAIPTNNMPAMVGQVETNVAKFSHCQYTAIELIDSEAKSTPLFKEDNSKPNITCIETGVIVGSEKKKFTLQVNPESSIAECGKKGVKDGKRVKDPHTKQLSVGKNTPHNVTIIKETPEKIDFEAWFDYDKINLIEYFFLTEEKLKTFPNVLLKADTCRHHHDVNVVIVPDMEWKISLLFNDKTMPQSLATTNMPSDLSRTSGSDTPMHPESKRKSIYEEQVKKATDATNQRKKGSSSYDFDLTITYTINKEPFEWGQNIAEKVKFFIDIFKTIKEGADTLCNNDKKHAQTIMKKLPKPKMMPAFIKIDYPAIKIDGSWKYAIQEHKNFVIEPTGELSFGFEPLIKGTGGIDLIALSFTLGKTVPVVNLVLEAIEVLEVGGDLLAGVFGYEISKKLELNIYVFSQINGYAKIPINSIDTIKFQVSGRLGIGVQLKAEVGVVKKGLVLEGDDDSSGDQGFGYALDAKAESFLELACSSGFDKKDGFFLEPAIHFGGIKLTIVAKKVGDKDKVKDKTFQLPAFYVVDPKKDWFKGRYHPFS
ncbi:hypothetical protein B0A58_02765 [Flavobacterium branchiophilum NBRC 15030 = ATCC 35035]|uniref:Uncharacterized protein n=1 Tax=Flavobacterium branchiophilum TaxID=55197 RepID=A0A543G241_9FLAO|nr:hypothetical protein [Flavobacterium branchiophilum]OXA80101.1 hypothetical protein B0A58_02765 [Flavobacterium branchiophilum NBRC 15030 = ATCC 35035]TQM40163.1 hypothetical protein BC670_1033 [Flavobacterium branchiophilum]GEM54940.1 hypothetical protein FB1_11610 [Flavobacterium branchiophilum NBRC 15030 = ATCC 35035]